MHQLLYASEHYNGHTFTVWEELIPFFSKETYSKPFGKLDDKFCFEITHNHGILSVNSSYYIGVDWIERGKVALFVEPKLNVKNENQVNFMSMLIDSLDAPENISHLDGLFDVNFDETWIAIPQQKDILSPILVVQFLKLLKGIVRMGLKKSYYTVTESLNSKIRGKILVGQQIKKNLLQNRHTSTICQYQEFGFNFPENQFLKTVLSFVEKYLHISDSFFSKPQKRQLNEIIDYCAPAFANVDELQDKRAELRVKNNVFFKDYVEAVRIGKFVLKRFSYNINKLSESSSMTPPFWVDMSKLFELYVFGKLKTIFSGPKEITYHDHFLGRKETDVLIRAKGFEAVVDCKYKPRYLRNNPSLEDMRQLAGYTRLKSVYKKLSISTDELINGLIIFSSQEGEKDIKREDLYSTPIDEYVGFYKLGIALPEI
ncbi:restriction endonuclease [Pedobacter foliorum]|uniref:5-methylcytosine restriction system specificity protein McrC n=1 Tax=Pedobacter foliorum TaxID=2739058 RepID=UPI0015635F12|nr:restriction endonuclease [Pedobacter foliorum]NRF37607.1 restriction endonuclease [Pedobacter foliorum]